MTEIPQQTEAAPDLDSPIWGIENFAKVIKRSERQTYHLVAKGRLPSVKKIGNRHVSTPRKLLTDILGEVA